MVCRLNTIRLIKYEDSDLLKGIPLAQSFFLLCTNLQTLFQRRLLQFIYLQPSCLLVRSVLLPFFNPIHFLLQCRTSAASSLCSRLPQYLRLASLSMDRSVLRSIFTTTTPLPTTTFPSISSLPTLTPLEPAWFDPTNSTTMVAPYTGQQASLPNAIAIAAAGFLSILFAYLPARSFWARRNIPALSIVVSTTLATLFYTANAVIWHNDDQAIWWTGFGLCDVEAALKYPLTTGFTASLCFLSWRLASCLDTSKGFIRTTKAQERRKILIDLGLCWTVPVLQLGLQYVVQNGRYSISPVFGCAFDLDQSWPASTLR